MQKIKVEADVSSVESELAKVKQAVTKVNAELASGGNMGESKAKKELDALVKRADALAAALERVNKANALHSKQANDAAKAFEQMARTSARLERNAGTSNPWASSWMQEAGSDAKIKAAMARVNPPVSGRWQGFGSQAAHAGSTVLGAIVGGGGVGSTAGSFLGSTVGKLFSKSPFAMLAGGAVGGAFGGAADRGYGEAKHAAITFSDTRRALGGLSADFFKLRDTVQAVNQGLGLTHNEAAELAKQFVKTSNTTATDISDVAHSVKTSAGFARGYGLDPSQTNQFFGSMRQNGVTRSEGDNRRLALMIGEAVGKGGNVAKMDEVLSSVSQYVNGSTRASLSEANVGGYLSMLNSLTGTGLAGLKNAPGNAAAILSQADQAVRGGGALGEGSRNFMFRALSGTNADLSSIDLDLLLSQGLFGSSKGAFGGNSAAYKAAQLRGDQGLMSHYDDLAKNGSTNLESIMTALERESGGDTRMLFKSMKGLFGVSENDAAALYSATKSDSGLGSLEASLAEAGVNLSDLKNMKSVATLAGLVNGGSAGAQWKQLKGMGISKADAGEVDNILKTSGEGDEFKKAIIRLTAKYDNTDPGDTLRKNQAEMKDLMQELVDDLLPIENAIKDGIVELVRHFDSDSGYVKAMDGAKLKQQWGEQYKSDPVIASVLDQMAATPDEADKVKLFNKLKKDISINDQEAFVKNPYDPEVSKRQKAHQKFFDELGINQSLWQGSDKPAMDVASAPADPDLSTHLPSHTAPAGKDWAGRLMKDLMEKEGLSKEAAAGVVGNLSHETGNFTAMQEKNPSAGRGGYGIAQWTGPRRKNFEKYAADNGLSPDSYEANFGFLHQELNSSYAGVLKGLKGAGSVAEATDLFARDFEAPGVMAMDKRLSASEQAYSSLDRMPTSQRSKPQSPSQSTQNVSFNGMFTLKDSLGRDVADPITHTWFGRPQPAGV